jgi:hypothetical protein
MRNCWLEKIFKGKPRNKAPEPLPKQPQTERTLPHIPTREQFEEAKALYGDQKMVFATERPTMQEGRVPNAWLEALGKF